MTDLADFTEEAPVQKRGISRRQFIPGVAAAIAALGGAGAAAGYTYREHHGGAIDADKYLSENGNGANALDGPRPGTPGSGLHRFVTRPDIHPPRIDVTHLSLPGPQESSPRFIVLAPVSDVDYQGYQRGPMIIDRHGRLVWFHPMPQGVFNVNVQSYQGEPTMTWWTGAVVDGHGIGTAMLWDKQYQQVASVDSTTQRPIDLHEFNLTSSGTALLSSYRQTTADLRSIGGSSKAQVLAGHAMEVDVRTGKVLFDWNSLDHVGVEESYEPRPRSPASPYDYFHINSISETEDGHLLISARNAWTVYKVHRTTGEILWRLNGKRSDFKVDADAQFSWQHHVRSHPGSAMTLFDNAPGSDHGSLALLLKLDLENRRASLTQAYQNPAKFTAGTLGSVQVLADGRVFVGWGVQPYFCEFKHDGTMAVNAQFANSSRSYRAFLVDWVGHPVEPPVVVATVNPTGGFLIYASWNGATEIDHWTVLAGESATSLAPVGSQPWSGFETAIVVNSKGPNFAAVAYDKHGNELGRSKVV